MAFSENNRVSIRKYLGASSIFKQLFPKLENAITASQAETDGGSQLDNSTELLVLSILTKIDNIELKIEALHCQAQVIEANNKEIVIDAARGIFLLKSEGRRQIGVLSRILGCSPVYDYFSSQMPSADDFANIYSVI